MAKFLSRIQSDKGLKVGVEKFKEEIRDIVVEFREPILMGTELDKMAREELLSKMIQTQETRPNTAPRSYKNSSTLKRKGEN